MHLQEKTLEILTDIIVGDQEHEVNDSKSGRQLVEFFNRLGFDDEDKRGYGASSSWRRMYTEDRLREINDTPKMEKCIKATFAVLPFAENVAYLDELIARFNIYLAYDRWQVVREDDKIILKELDKVIIREPKANQVQSEEEFLRSTFEINVDGLKLGDSLTEIIRARIQEAEKCIRADAPLAGIILIGSVMEAVLIGTAKAYPQPYNTASLSPKDEDGKVRKWRDWSLSTLIDVSSELKVVGEDVRKFSHALRDFRNYVHPYQQMQTGFSPDKNTAEICLQVLKLVIKQVEEFRKTHPSTNFETPF